MKPRLTTTQPTARFLTEHVRRLYANLSGAARGEEVPIHQVRVASRRLRVALPIAARRPTGRRVLRAARGFRALARIAGEGRDLDICANILAEELSQAGLPHAVATMLERRLRIARLRAHHRLVEGLASAEATKLLTKLDAIVARGGAKSDDTKTVLAAHMRREARRALAELGALGKRFDPTALHTLRRRIRWLRYLAEIDQALFRGKATSIKGLKDLQEILGRLHDALVFAEWIAPMATSWERRGAPDRAAAARSFMERLHLRARAQHRRFLASQPRASLRGMLRRSAVLLKASARLGLMRSAVKSARGHSKKADVAHQARLLACRGLATNCAQEDQHAEQVTRLALILFDQLKGLHRMGGKQRRRLEYAALLHDIGWKEGGHGHNKASLRLILKADELPFGKRERRIVASVARYHRGPVPKKQHSIYRRLARRDQRLVQLLAAILRVADGLDRSHRNAVTALRAFVDPGRVMLTCAAFGAGQAERAAVLKKGDLFSRVFLRKLSVECYGSTVRA